MDAVALPIAGAHRLRTAMHHDQRGSFERLYDAAAFARLGLGFTPRQTALSTNPLPHTLRGLHYQAGDVEAKLVRVLRGRIFDVMVDLRPSSPSFGEWYGLELSAESPDQLFIPAGCAHGFLTLGSDAWVAYHISCDYDPAAGRGIRWNDPTLAIAWPATPALISDRDRAWPTFEEATRASH